MKNLIYALGLFIFTYYSYADYPWSFSEVWSVPVKFGSDDLTTALSYLKLSPDGKEVIHFKPWNWTINWYNSETGEKIKQLNAPDKMFGAILINNGTKLMYTNREGRIVEATYPDINKIKTYFQAVGYKFQYFASLNKVALIDLKEINLIDLEKEIILEKITIPYSEEAVYSISTNKAAYITTSNLDTQSEACYVNVVDEDGKLEFQYALRCGSAILADRVRIIAVSNDGNLLAFHGKDLHLYIYDFRTGELKKSSTMGGQIGIMEFTSDNNYVYIGNNGYGISRINVETLQMESLGGGYVDRDLCFNFDTTAQYTLTSSEIRKYNIKRNISSIEETELKLVKSYTQSDGILNIELIDYSQVRAITISNMQGKILTSVNTFTSKTTQIDISTYPKGTYFVTILTIDNHKEIIKISI